MARKNLEKARQAQSARAKGESPTRPSQGMSTAEEHDVREPQFAFPEQRKEPIHDAAHVRNAVARFDQVEGVTDADHDRAGKRINAAAKEFGVDIEADHWRELFEGGGTAKKR